jgi:hypothetical protein
VEASNPATKAVRAVERIGELRLSFSMDICYRNVYNQIKRRDGHAGVYCHYGCSSLWGIGHSKSTDRGEGQMSELEKIAKECWNHWLESDGDMLTLYLKAKGLNLSEGEIQRVRETMRDLASKWSEEAKGGAYV